MDTFHRKRILANNGKFSNPCFGDRSAGRSICQGRGRRRTVSSGSPFQEKWSRFVKLICAAVPLRAIQWALLWIPRVCLSAPTADDHHQSSLCIKVIFFCCYFFAEWSISSVREIKASFIGRNITLYFAWVNKNFSVYSVFFESEIKIVLDYF